MRDLEDAAVPAAGTEALDDELAHPSRARGRASVAAARRRRQRSVVIAVAVLASFTVGCWVGSVQGDRGLVVGAGAERLVESPPTNAVEEPSEVRPTDLLERAQDRGAAPAPPGPDDFVTPSGNILCAYAGGQLDCHIGSGLVPPPAHRCPQGAGEWAGIRLGRDGPSVPWCTTVRLEDRTAPTLELAYGQRWARDGIECTSHRDGLRCVNDGGGELLLSRAATRHGRRPTNGERRSSAATAAARPTRPPGNLDARLHPEVEAP